jgi:hypothetical protein
MVNNILVVAVQCGGGLYPPAGKKSHGGTSPQNAVKNSLQVLLSLSMSGRIVEEQPQQQQQQQQHKKKKKQEEFVKVESQCHMIQSIQTPFYHTSLFKPF